MVNKYAGNCYSFDGIKQAVEKKIITIDNDKIDIKQGRLAERVVSFQLSHKALTISDFIKDIVARIFSKEYREAKKIILRELENYKAQVVNNNLKPEEVDVPEVQDIKEQDIEQLNEVYKALFKDLEELELDAKQKEYVKKTVIGFHKFNLHKEELKEYLQRQVTEENKQDFILDKTGLAMNLKMPEQYDIAFEQATEVLQNMYQQAKEKNKLKEFFEKAFDSKEKQTIEPRYMTIADWGVENLV